jgi:dTDP-4-amino-4,6-dideoxygalactose transaminase
VIDGAASFVSLAEHPDHFLDEIPVAISLHATKAFATGEGGAVAVADVELTQRVAQALNFGIWDIRGCRMPNTNGKMSEYHAAVGLAEFDGWTEKLEMLNRVADCYHQCMTSAGLADRLYAAPDIGPNYTLFRCGDAAEVEHVRVALERSGVGSRLWYGKGVQHETYYHQFSRDNLTETEGLAPYLLGLPVAPDLSESAIARIVAVLLGAVTDG